MMIVMLLFIFVILSLFSGGDRTAKSLITIGLNIAVLFAAIKLIYLDINPLAISSLLIVLVSLITIYYQNEVNLKTHAAFLSVILTVILMIGMIVFFVYKAHLQGLTAIGDVHINETNGYKGNIDKNMLLIQISVIMTALVGAIIDTAVAVSSGLFEVYKHNKTLSFKELFESGLNIGKQILNSTVNTLSFIFLGEYMIMFINYLMYYSFATMINSKDFAQGIISITVSAIACILIIPIVSAISAWIYIKISRENSNL